MTNFLVNLLTCIGLIPKTQKPKITGFQAFCNCPYPKNKTYKLRTAVPLNEKEYKTFSQLEKQAEDTVALVDAYYSHSSMLDRINFACSFPRIKYIELLNEIPHMPYPGQQIKSQTELLEITNIMDIAVKTKGRKSVGMAPANILQKGNTKFNVDSWKQLKDIILYTKVDVANIHVYATGNKLKGLLRIKKLANSVNSWLDEAEKNHGYRKEIWITECGDKDNHEEFAKEWLSRLQRALKPKRTYWYRLSALDGDIDSEYSAWREQDNCFSPVWKYLYHS